MINEAGNIFSFLAVIGGFITYTAIMIGASIEGAGSHSSERHQKTSEVEGEVKKNGSS